MTLKGNSFIFKFIRSIHSNLIITEANRYVNWEIILNLELEYFKQYMNHLIKLCLVVMTHAFVCGIQEHQKSNQL